MKSINTTTTNYNIDMKYTMITKEGRRLTAAVYYLHLFIFFVIFIFLFTKNILMNHY